jgi:hypothetical protein
MDNLPDKKRGVPSKQILYQKAAGHAIDAIEVLAKLMYEADNDAAKVGAAKCLLSKCIPDLKATELTGEDGNEILIKILDYAQHRNTDNTPAKTETSPRN